MRERLNYYIKRLETIHQELLEEELKMISILNELTLRKVVNESHVSDLFMSGKIDGTNEHTRKAQITHYRHEAQEDIAIYENMYAEQRAYYNAKKREADDLQYIVRLIESTIRPK